MLCVCTYVGHVAHDCRGAEAGWYNRYCLDEKRTYSCPGKDERQYLTVLDKKKLQQGLRLQRRQQNRLCYWLLLLVPLLLKRAADRAADRHPGLAAMGAQGAAVYNSWLAQLSCTLQKANVACLRSASAGGRGPATGASPADALAAGADGLAADAEEDWLAAAVDELLHQAAANAGL